MVAQAAQGLSAHKRRNYAIAYAQFFRNAGSLNPIILAQPHRKLRVSHDC